jgi:hypothetical protein
MILCECGCGGEIISKQHHKYKPVKYLHGHYNSNKYKPNPLILCECGCGKRLEKFDSARRERKYIYGHNANGKNNPMYGIQLFGKSNGNWKGGISRLSTSIRTLQKYIDWRTQIFGRDNFTCRECNLRGNWLEVHHIKRFIDIIRDNNIKTSGEAIMCLELWDLNNGITLCKECHNKKDMSRSD